MAFDTDLLVAMPHTATFLPLTGVDQYGKRLYGAGIVATCYWQEEYAESEAPDGQTTSHSGLLYCAPPSFWPVPQAADLVPTTDFGLILANGRQVQIKHVTAYRDQDGLLGIEVAYG